LARIYGVFSPTWPQCGGTMRIIAFIDDLAEVKDPDAPGRADSAAKTGPGTRPDAV
jgi:hypothetical protein